MKHCYLCGKNGPVKAFTKLGFEIDKCTNCGLYSLNFKGNYPKFLKTYYQKGFFTGGKRFRAYADYEGDKSIHMRNLNNHLKGLIRVLNASARPDAAFYAAKGDKPIHLRNLQGHLKGLLHVIQSPKFTVQSPASKSFKLLDAGCAMGYFMELARDADFDVHGIDVSEYAVNIARQTFGDRVKLGQIENIDKLFSQSVIPTPSGVEGEGSSEALAFNVVTLFDLLEHLQNPREVLEKINKCLNDNGLVVIQTGNVSSLWARLLGKNWHFFAPPQHFFFFTEDNLKELLRQTGFEVIKIDRDGKWVSLRYLFHMMRYVNKVGLGDFLYKLTHKNFLGKIPVLFKFGDNIILYARKEASHTVGV